MTVELRRLELDMNVRLAIWGYIKKFQYKSLPIYFLDLKLERQAMGAGTSYIQHITPGFSFSP